LVRIAIWKPPIDRASALISSRQSLNGMAMTLSPLATASVILGYGKNGLGHATRDDRDAGKSERDGTGEDRQEQRSAGDARSICV